MDDSLVREKKMGQGIWNLDEFRVEKSNFINYSKIIDLFIFERWVVHDRWSKKFHWSTVASETKRKREEKGKINDSKFLTKLLTTTSTKANTNCRRTKYNGIRIIIGMPYRLRISAWGNRTDKNELCRWMLRRCRRCIKPTQLAHSPSLSIHWRGRHARRDCGPEIRTVPMFHLWHFVQSHASDIRRCLISW